MMLCSSNSRLRSLIKYFITLRTKHLRSSLDSCSSRISSTKGAHVPLMNISCAYGNLASNSACMRPSFLYGARLRGVFLKSSETTKISRYHYSLFRKPCPAHFFFSRARHHVIESGESHRPNFRACISFSIASSRISTLFLYCSLLHSPF
jgi:hypothetical protein